MIFFEGNLFNTELAMKLFFVEYDAQAGGTHNVF